MGHKYLLDIPEWQIECLRVWSGKTFFSMADLLRLAIDKAINDGSYNEMLPQFSGSFSVEVRR